MRRGAATALCVVGALGALVGCGGSDEAKTSPSHGLATPAQLSASDLIANLGEARDRGTMCFRPGPLRTDAGESFVRAGEEGAMSPKQVDRRNRRAIRSALAPTVRSELRRARAVAHSIVLHRVNLVHRAVERGIRQSLRSPALLARGWPSSFQNAQGIADRFGLSSCSRNA